MRRLAPRSTPSAWCARTHATTRLSSIVGTHNSFAQRPARKTLRAGGPPPGGAGGSLAALEEFVRLYNDTVPASDVSLRTKLATLESIEYLHIADPLVEDPREQNEMEAVRRLVARRYGLDLDQTDLELLTEIIRNDTDTQASDAETIVDDAGQAPSGSGSKIVTADDDLDSVFSDPDFLAAVGEVQASDATKELSTDEILQAAPRLFFSLIQRGGFSGSGTATSAPPRSLPFYSDDKVPTLDLQDPLGLEPVVFDFLGDDLQTVQREAPETEDTSTFEFRSTPSGVRHRRCRLYRPVQAALEGLSKRSLKTAVRAPWLSGAPLRLQTGVSLVAVGTSLSIEATDAATPTPTPDATKTRHPAVNRAYIVSGDTAEQLKTVANDLYPQLLMSCLDVVPREPETQSPLPRATKKTKVDVSVAAEVAAGRKKPRRPSRVAKRQAKRKKVVPDIEYV